MKINNEEIDVYDLINSNAISKHCRKLNYHFNALEVAVLIYRNIRMSIEEKINAYNEIIENYEDMSIVKYSNFGPYEIPKKQKKPVEEISTKEQVRKEIKRLEDLYKKIILKEEGCFYTATTYWQDSGIVDSHNFDFIKDTFEKSYNRVLEKIKDELKDERELKSSQKIWDRTSNYISEFTIMKIAFNNEYKIDARYVVDMNKRKIILNDIIDREEDQPVFASIYIFIPTPFKKGDLLYSRRNARLEYGYLSKDDNVFVLKYKSNCKEDIEDPEDDLIYSIEGGDICLHECWEWDYDSWEYFENEPELKGLQRILKGISSLLKNEVSVDLFMKAYTKMKLEEVEENKCWKLELEEDRLLKKLGFNNEDIKKIKKE